MYDVTIYDETGTALCSMSGLELRKNTIELAPHIDCRYEMISQPVLPSGLSPRIEPTWTREREDKARRADILQTLDRLAHEMLQKSLEEDVQVGERIDGRRYGEFVRSAVTRSDPPSPISRDVEAMKQVLSAPFEIMERVAKVHKDLFGSSTVRFLTRPFDSTPLIFIDRQRCKHSLRMI